MTRDSLSSDMVQHLLIDQQGKLWLATWDGLDVYDRATEGFTTFRHTPANRGENFYSITQDRSGMIWVGSNVGIRRFDPRTNLFSGYEHVLNDFESLSDNRVNDIFVSSTGRMWVGTQNGLDQFDPDTGKFKNVSQAYGMNGNIVSCVMEDVPGHLWMSTDKGISQFDPDSSSFKNYSTADGLPGPDLTGWNACSKSDSGEMFFGGFSGAAAFRPSAVVDQAYAPPVVFTDFRVSGIPVSPGGKSPLKQAIGYQKLITLEHDQKVFSVEFSALGYSSAETNRYRHKLDGVDSTWIETASDERVASYTTLPAGFYTLHVQGATSRGPWSSPEAMLQIRILPPWWATWTIKLFFAAATLVLLSALYRYRSQQLVHQFRVLADERVRERTRIARDLHDTLLQSFQGLVLRFEAVASRIPATEPARERFYRIATLSSFPDLLQSQTERRA